MELRDLAVHATARAVRTLHGAQRHGGLLALAVCQLHFNWESSRNSITWFGQLLQEIHAVWPRFKLSCASGISWTGVPPADKVETLGRRFSAAVWQSRWLDRQLSVLSKRPKISQQDVLLFHILLFGKEDDFRQIVENRRNIDRSCLSLDAIFSTKHSVSVRSFRRLLRFAAGLEDYARTSGHYPRRHIFPELAREDLKRTCLFCYVHCNHKILDSEWHSFFSCPACENPRHIFCKAFPRFYDLFFPQHDPLHETAGPTQDQITSLANIIYEARFSRNLTNELARFVSGIHACRQREFSSLLKNSPLSPLGAALRQGVLVN